MVFRLWDVLLCKSFAPGKGEQPMKKPIKVLLGIVSAAALVLCALCVLFIVQYVRGQSLNDRLGGGLTSALLADITVDPDSDTRYMATDIDFDELTALNDDIYAWIEVPGTVINYAVVQSDTDDLYYNNHGVDGAYFSGGSIYSQRYNSRDFQDSMTVLYGHNRQSQTMFAQLNNFADAAYFDEHRDIYIYTPDTVYRYEIFAAYVHSSEHLMLCYDFEDQAQFEGYFAALTDDLNANYRRELFPAYGDKVLTLSTCYRQNRMQRYLVQAVLAEQFTVLQK